MRFRRWPGIAPDYRPEAAARLGREPKTEFYGRIFGMYAPLDRPDDQRRLRPGPVEGALGKVACAHETEQPDQRIRTLPKDHGPLPDQREARGAPSLVDPLPLTVGQGKNAREESAGREVLRRRQAVVADVTAQLEAARHLLRVIAMYASVFRKVRRAAEHQVESLAVRDDARGPKITQPDVHPIVHAIEP